MAFACLHVRPPAMDHGLLGTCYKASHSGVPSISFFCVNGELTVYAFLLVTTRLRHMWRRVLLQQVCLQQRMARSRRRQRLRAAFQLGQFPWASTNDDNIFQILHESRSESKKFIMDIYKDNNKMKSFLIIKTII